MGRYRAADIIFFSMKRFRTAIAFICIYVAVSLCFTLVRDENYWVREERSMTPCKPSQLYYCLVHRNNSSRQWFLP